MAASGVRSSWLASVMNWRILRSDAARSPSALSTWSSSLFMVSPTSPTSVHGSVSESGILGVIS
jgi:hypothetical protein